MFDSTPGVHDQVFQLYISMLEDLIVDTWSAAEYLRNEGHFTTPVPVDPVKGDFNVITRFVL